MSSQVRLFALLGAVNAFVSVAAGAFGAHALQTRLDEKMRDIFEVGARYQMYHALALLFAAWLVDRGARGATLAGWLLVAGIVLFSGSLYALALTGTKGLGAITPLGGLCFLAAWALLALGAYGLGRG
jgi:uncharacterized membrane protein YgdD (TMEM256/DUF423 family)